jgi:amidase
MSSAAAFDNLLDRPTHRLKGRCMTDRPQLTSSIPASEWDYCTIKDLVADLRLRRVSALEVLDHTIARIEALDARLNAVVVRDFDRAREAAKAADAALAHGDHRPLSGVPITIKEAFNIAGLPTTWGSPRFEHFVPAEDALAVSRLKSAGAVVLGKTNVPLVLADFQSYNDVYGTTNNPWDVGRSPGGSSGGSAAALAAGFGPLSMGSDIGGSLRVPAHFCGVYAHKPSLDLVPTRGHSAPPLAPLPGNGDLAVIGPMTRTAADLWLALDVIAGPDEHAEGVGYRLALPAPRHAHLKDFRVLVVDTHPLIPTGSAVREAIGHLAERMAKAGVTVSHSSALLPDLAASARLYMRLLTAAKSLSMTSDGFEEAQRLAAALDPGDDGLGAARARGTVMTHRDWLETDRARAQMREQWSTLFCDWDVVVYPAASVPAFPHDHSLPIEARHLEVDGNEYPYYDACFAWADPASTCGLPATAAPIDHSPSGLPIGVQIIGPYLEDLTTIAFAELLEWEFGGFVPPPGYA